MSLPGARTALTGEHLARRRACLGALLVTVPAGLVWRLAPLHLPWFASKYGGSALWAIAVYWAVAVLRPTLPPSAVAVRAVLVAFLVEFLKKVYWAPLDRFRETLAGKLLLGRYFSYGALLAYLLAIVAVAGLDLYGVRRRQCRA